MTAVFRENEKVRVLWAPTELGAHILGFCCTIGTYLRAKYEGQTPTELGERALSIFAGIDSYIPLAAASLMMRHHQGSWEASTTGN